MADIERWTDDDGQEAVVIDGHLSFYGQASAVRDDGMVAVGIDLPWLANLQGAVEALEQIASGPDASKGENYGCLDLHEARTIARQALDRLVDLHQGAVSLAEGSLPLDLQAAALEIEELRGGIRRAVRLMDDARGHYGIEETAGPGKPATEWDEVQHAMHLFAYEWRDRSGGR